MIDLKTPEARHEVDRQILAIRRMLREVESAADRRDRGAAYRLAEQAQLLCFDLKDLFAPDLPAPADGIDHGSQTLAEAGYTPGDVVTVVTGKLGGPEGSVTGVITGEGAETTVVRMYSARRLWNEPYPVVTADIKEIRPAGTATPEQRGSDRR